MFNEKYIRYLYVIFFLSLEGMLWKAIVPALGNGEKVVFAWIYSTPLWDGVIR